MKKLTQLQLNRMLALSSPLVLRNYDLRGLDFHGADLSQADMTGSNAIGGNFAGCTLPSDSCKCPLFLIGDSWGGNQSILREVTK